jgi:putative inorganic carbon (hco3(-)) transporter
MWVSYLAFVAVLPVHELLNLQVGFTLKLFNVFLFLCIGFLSLRTLNGDGGFRKTPLDKWLGWFLCANLVSLVPAENANLGFRLLIALFFMYMSYYVTVNCVPDMERFLKSIRVAAYSAVVVSLYGIYEVVGFLMGYNTGVYFNPGEAWFPRVKSTMQEPAYFANYLLLVFPLLITWWINGKRDIFGKPWRMIAVMGSIFAAIIMTVSKGTILALACLMPLCFYGRGLAFAAKWAMSALAGVLIIGGIVLYLLLHASSDMNVQSDLDIVLYESFLNPDQGSYTERKDANATSWRMFLDHPFLGVGIGNYGANYDQYKPADANTAQTDVTLTPNNILLNLLAENGILGLALFGSMLIHLVLKMVGFLRARAPDDFAHVTVVGLGYGLATMLMQYMFSAYFYFPHFWVLLGFIVAVMEMGPDRNDRVARMRIAA